MNRVPLYDTVRSILLRLILVYAFDFSQVLAFKPLDHNTWVARLTSATRGLEGDWTHETITLKAARDYLGDQEYPNKNSQRTLAWAEIARENALVDVWKFHDPVAHFDNNSFEAGNRRLIEKKGLILNALRHEDYSVARAELGRAFHTLQDFYTHTTWVEHFAGILTNLGSAEAATNIWLNHPIANESACQDCVVDTCCSGNVRAGTLSSGWFVPAPPFVQSVEISILIDRLWKRKKPLGMCSHGGEWDYSRHEFGRGGINKDTSDCAESPHGKEYHLKAANRAVDASALFLRNIHAELEKQTSQEEAKYLMDSLFGVMTIPVLEGTISMSEKSLYYPIIPQYPDYWEGSDDNWIRSWKFSRLTNMIDSPGMFEDYDPASVEFTHSGTFRTFGNYFGRIYDTTTIARFYSYPTNQIYVGLLGAGTYVILRYHPPYSPVAHTELRIEGLVTKRINGVFSIDYESSDRWNNSQTDWVDIGEFSISIHLKGVTPTFPKTGAQRLANAAISTAPQDNLEPPPLFSKVRTLLTVFPKEAETNVFNFWLEPYCCHRTLEIWTDSVTNLFVTDPSGISKAATEIVSINGRSSSRIRIYGNGGQWSIKSEGAKEIRVDVSEQFDVPNITFLEVGGRPGHEAAFSLSRDKLFPKEYYLQCELPGFTTNAELHLLQPDGDLIKKIELQRMTNTTQTRYMAKTVLPAEAFLLRFEGPSGAGRIVRYSAEPIVPNAIDVSITPGYISRGRDGYLSVALKPVVDSPINVNIISTNVLSGSRVSQQIILTNAPATVFLHTTNLVFYATRAGFEVVYEFGGKTIRKMHWIPIKDVETGIAEAGTTPKMEVHYVDHHAVIFWGGSGWLESSADLRGPWHPIPEASEPAILPVVEQALFIRHQPN